jgi:hypothetical protein
MPNADEAKEALEGLNDISLGTKPLVVKEAEERSSGSGGGGGSRGGYRGGNSGGGGGYNKGYNNNRDRNRY